MSDVFISYSADAKKWAEKLSDSLDAEGLSAWSDFKSLRPGERWFDQLQRALDDARFYILVVGPRNVTRETQDREWQAALEHTWSDSRKRIIPVLIGHADSPPFLRNWVSLKFDPALGESALMEGILSIIKGSPRQDKRERELARPDKGRQKRIRDIKSEIKSAAKQLKSQQG